ncbi:MAG TPA: serine/threonine-protein kinase [Candidatus Eisenbacteria bacterium]
MAETVDRLRAALADRYRVQRELGRGGMATVYLAEDLRHHRPVALKVLLPEVAAALGPERFLREIEAAARLNHPHILPLYESGSAGGLLYYAMPYAEGESLRQRLEREKQLPVAEAVRIAHEVADALDYAHRRGVVHRDIKPENILLAEQHAVVADFGIARAIVAAGGEKLTTTGLAIGTPVYMSPEQGAGTRELDRRSDLYSLGCVLYEMLSGQPPFTGPTAESLAHQHLSIEPRPVAMLRTTVPPQVDRALAKALAKAAADRFGTAAEFAAALAPRPATDTAPAEPRQAKPARRRARALVAGAAIVVIAIGAFAVVKKPGPLSRWLGGSDAALRRPQRLTTVQRLLLEADQAGIVGDLPSAVAAYERVRAYDPTNLGAMVNSGVASACWAVTRSHFRCTEWPHGRARSVPARSF